MRFLHATEHGGAVVLCEGSYFLPDTAHGAAYLEAIKRVFLQR